MSLWQDFIDSKPGIVTGSALHTLGAILMLGGLALYWEWQRRARGGQDIRQLFASGLVATYLAIFMNMLGGVMRTYQSDHPNLSEFSDSLWVQVLLDKHVFLLAGMAAAVYLFEGYGQRLRRAVVDGTAGAVRRSGHETGFALAMASILVATVLGAVTQVAFSPSESDDFEPEPLLGPLFHNATGLLTSTPIAAQEATGTFVVPVGVAAIEASLLWDDTVFDLRLSLEGPNGIFPAEPSEGGQIVAVAVPNPGSWTYVIGSDLAVDVPWTLSIRMDTVPADGSVMVDRITLRPGIFYEINTQMPEGGSLGWDWRIVEDEAVHFDLHSHFDDEVQYYVEETAAAGRGSFTNERGGGYSLLWDNEGTLPVTLEFRIWGDFEVDSIVGG